MNKRPAAQGSDAILLTAYEDLRREVLGGVSPKSLGLSVLLGQGMAAWVKACSAMLAGPSNSYPQPAVPVPAASDLHGEVVRILVCMALGQMRSGRA